jgi:uncharacterized glyoxalase superfamily protein PhnB
MTTRIALIPALRYQNAPAAIEFLCAAFGFERHAVYADEQNPSIIHHAQLTLGDSMIMLGSARPDATAEKYHWRTPAEAGGVTMSIYAVIADPDAHAAGARAAGADIIGEPHDNQGYPGRGYEVRDTEGNIWSFGSYDPWQGES